MTPERDLTQFNSTQLTELSQLNIFSGFLQKCNFLDCRGIKVLSYDVSRNFFRQRWASPPVQLILLVGWPFYNSKSFKPNRLASSFKKRKQKTFSYFSSYCQSFLLSQMAKPSACQSLCRNPPPIGKDKFAGAAPTESSGIPTPTPAVSRAFTPVPAPPPTLAIALSPTATNSAAKYSTKDL